MGGKGARRVSNRKVVLAWQFEETITGVQTAGPLTIHFFLEDFKSKGWITVTRHERKKTGLGLRRRSSASRFWPETTVVFLVDARKIQNI
jgi:hypothetical protein